VKEQSGSAMWIGLSDAEAEGVFTWVEAGGHTQPPEEPPTFLNWMAGEPDAGNAASRDYVFLDADSGTWGTADLLTKHFGVAEQTDSPWCGAGEGICEEEHCCFGCEDVSCCTLIQSIDPFCYEDIWDQICADEAIDLCSPAILQGPVLNPSTGSRYQLLEDAAWTEAAEVAYHLGGHLTVFETEAEAEWVRLNFSVAGGADRQLWIGLTDVLTQKVFRWVTNEPLGAWVQVTPNVSEYAQYVVLTPAGTFIQHHVAGNAPDPTFGFGVVEVPCIADLDGSLEVDGADLGLLLGAWDAGPSDYDLNIDGNVDGADLGLLLAAWGSCGESACCAGGGVCEQPGCLECACAALPACCDAEWDLVCAEIAAARCDSACQCPPSAQP
jgi:hypothetical protein